MIEAGFWLGWVLWHIKPCRLFNAKSSLYIYRIWFGWVLWHINYFRLFNAKFALYIYIRYIWFGLVWFYGISTTVGYLMPNPLYKYHHHHHVVLVARISLTISHHFSLSLIVSGRSFGLHPVSSHSCWMYVRAGRPAFAKPYVGVHRSTSLMSSSLLFQQCPACLVCLTWIVFMIRGRWPYSWWLVGCCRQDLFKIACSILV